MESVLRRNHAAVGEVHGREGGGEGVIQQPALLNRPPSATAGAEPSQPLSGPPVASVKILSLSAAVGPPHLTVLGTAIEV